MDESIKISKAIQALGASYALLTSITNSNKHYLRCIASLSEEIGAVMDALDDILTEIGRNEQ